MSLAPYSILAPCAKKAKRGDIRGAMSRCRVSGDNRSSVRANAGDPIAGPIPNPSVSRSRNLL
jgi:hypothetical protein